MTKYIFNIFLLSLIFCLPISSTGQIKKSILEQDLQIAEGLVKKHDVLEVKEKYKEATFPIKKAASIFAKHNIWRKNVECLLSLSHLYGYLDYNLKATYAKTAINTINTYLPHQDSLLSIAKIKLAHAFIQLDRLDSAHLNLQHAIPIMDKYENWSALLGCYYDLTLINYQKQNFHEAKTFINKGLSLGNLHKIDRFNTNFLNILSIIYYQEGDYQQAIQSIKKIIAKQQSIEAPTVSEKKNLAHYLRNLGAFYARKGEYKKALDCYLTINQKYDFQDEQIIDYFPTQLNDISKILFRQQKFPQAILTLKKSIQLNQKKTSSKKIQKSLITSYYVLADNYERLLEYDSAKYYSKLAIEVPLDYKRNISYLQLANIELAQNDTKACFQQLANSLKSYKLSNKQDQNYLIKKFSLTAKAHKKQLNYKKGLQAIQKALVTNCNPFRDTLNLYSQPPLRKIAFPTQFLNSLQTKAKLFTKLSNSEKDQKAALQTYQLTIQWIDTLQNSYVLEGSQLFWSKKYKEIYGEAIDLCYQFYQQTNDQQYLKLAFDIAEKSKALLLLEGIKDTEGKAVAGLPDSLIRKEKDLKIDLAFYEKSLQTAKDKKQADRIKLYQGYLADTRLNLGNLKEQMEADYPDYFQLKYANTTISIPEIQAKLIDQQSAFVEYFLGASTAYAFVIGKNQQAFIRLDAVSTIQHKSKNFLAQLKNPAAVQQNAKLAYQNYNQAAYELYQVILEAVTKELSSTIEQLIFAPDDVLNNFPFEVLTTEMSPQPSMDFGTLPYLFSNYQIHYAYSANLLWKNQQRQSLIPANTLCYAVAPPYKEKGKMSERGTLLAVRSGTVHLEGTGREIQGIANYFEGDYDSSSRASKANFLNNAPKYGLLHLAMHGEASGQDAAHLIFTNLQSDSTNDNLLYHYEIANMDLTAQLAVLSACETGVGEYVQGEGVFSLARSFMYAGVPSLAMTLWKVNDGTTSVLMPYFYKNLSEGMTKSTALHTAKKHFSQNAGLEFRHPYYWSGFVLLGNGGALKMGNAWWPYGLGGMMLFLGGLFGFRWFKKS